MTASAYNSSTQAHLTLDGGPLDLKQVHQVSSRRFPVQIASDPDLKSRVAQSVDSVLGAVENGERIYGVTTGFGGMADLPLDTDAASDLQNNLLWFLAAGAGRPVERMHVRAAMLLRANVLLQGYSGVRLELIERLIDFVNADFVPDVRDLGSIGASGDLIPLAKLARCITGQQACRVWSAEGWVTAREALRQLGREPIQLQPKEGLALVNGTSFSSAIAANVTHETHQLAALSMVVESMMMLALNVQIGPFDPFVHGLKPHWGQGWVAQEMLKMMSVGIDQELPAGKHVQDRYALRCFPQYFGPLVEKLVQVGKTVTVEMNSVSDNPLIDPMDGSFHQGGNFLGQYISMAMDDLRRCIGLIAKHLDVQIAQLVSPEFSRGLPASLRGNEANGFNMGLKGLQICANSIAPQLTYFGNPITEHFPTHAEQFNQNVNGLSWGSANLAAESLRLFRHYMSVAVVFAVQAIDLRAAATFGHFDGRGLLGPLARQLYESIYDSWGRTPGKEKPLVFDDADQVLDVELEKVHDSLLNGESLWHVIDPVLDSLHQVRT